jgi:hypothetical protein
MALDKQVVGIDLTKGVDKKRDSRLMVPGELTLLRNAVFDTSNVLKKRAGNAAVAMTGASGSAKKLMLHGEQLLELPGNNVYSETSQKWYSAANTYAPTGHNAVRHAEKFQSSDNMVDADHAILNGVCMVAWRTDGAGIKASVFDTVSGARYVSETDIDASGFHPRVLAHSASGKLLLFYCSGGNIKLSYVSTSAPNSFTTVTVVNDYRSGGNGFDAVVNSLDSNLIAMVYDRTGFDLKYARVLHDGSLGGTRTAVGIVSNFINVTVFAGGRVGAFYASGGTAMAVTVFEGNATAVVATTTIEAAVTPEFSIAYASGTDLLCWYTTGAGTSTQQLKVAIVDNSGAVTFGPVTRLRGMRIISKPDTSNRFLVQNNSVEQPTAFMVNSDEAVLAKALVWSLGDGIDYRLPQMHVTAESELSVMLPHRSQLLYYGTNLSVVNGFTRVLFDFEQVRPTQRVEFGSLTYLLGALPKVYDGAGPVESGFNYYPEAPTAADNGAGALSAGAYQYAAVYEWRDSKGNRHRSVASSPGSVTLIASRQARVTLPTLRQTAKRSPRGGVTIVVYRTAADGSLFYRVGSAANSTSAHTVLFDDNISDANLVSGEILYTTAGELDDETIPPCRVGCVHQNRLVVAGLENPYEWRYSKELEAGYVPGFSEVQAGTVPPTKGEITALASMDDKLFLFCERGIWCVTGAGPNALGLQNGYSEPQAVSDDVGCQLAYPNSVVGTPLGLMFLSAQGIRLLSRGHSVELVGAPVDTLATACVAAILLPDQHQVRFYTGSVALVFDYLWQQWSEFTNQTALDVVVWNNAAVVLRDASTVRQDGGTTDAGTAIAMSLETGWLHLAGVQGLQRVYRFLFLGSFSTSGSVLSLEAGYDYEAAWATAVTVDAAAVYSTSVPVQFRHPLPKQKCSAIRLRLAETSGTGAGMSWANFSLEVGAKAGALKLPATKTI